jgi:hypothetical protein
MIVQYLSIGRAEALAIPIEAKAGLVGFAENILVTNNSEKQQEMIPVPNFRPFCVGNQIRPSEKRCLLTSAEDKPRWHVVRHCGGPKFSRVFRSIRYADVYADVPQNGRRFPVIFEGKFDVKSGPTERIWRLTMPQFMEEKDIGALDAWQGLGCGFCCVSGLISDQGCIDKGCTLQQSDSNQQTIENDGMPFLRRLVLAVFLNLSGYGIAVWGISHFDDKRRTWRAAFIFGGWLILSSGYLLLFITGFQSTWNWWV